MKTRDSRIPLVLLFSIASAAVWWWLKGDTLNSDEAVIGLMALKISRGIDFPFFFWKADYCGPIASYLAAPLHWFFQPSGRLLHLVLIPLHAIYVTGIYLTARAWLKPESALVAALFAAMPFSLFTYSPLGGYTESLVLLPWIIYAFFGPESGRPWRYFAGGVLNGFALWVFPLSVPMIVVSFAFLYRESRGWRFRSAMKGLALSLIPMAVFNIEHPAASLLRLLSRPLQLSRQNAIQSLQANGVWRTGVAALQRWFALSLASLRALPETALSLMGLSHTRSLWIPAAGAVALVGLLFVLLRLWSKENGAIPQVLAWLTIAQSAYFVVFGMQRDRYLIPLLMVAPFGLAWLYSRFPVSTPTYQRYGVVVLILALNALSNYTDLADYPNGYPALARHLEESGMTRGYTDYFTAYPLIYLSNERLVFSPAFVTSEADRYAPYTEMVAHSGDQALVLDNDPERVQRFRDELKSLGMKSTEEVWQNYVLFTHLTPPLQ